MHSGFEVDLLASEPEMFARMTSACRRCIRKAQKLGVVIEPSSDSGFVDDYYAQLRDVFAKQGVFPTYPIDRVRLLHRHLHPTGNLLLLRARDAQGQCIATGIFPAWNRTMYFWGGASWREHQSNRPNELLMWHAMLYWKSRGIHRFDMGGSGEYKRKYGGNEIGVPWLRKSRYGWISTARKQAERMHYRLENLKGVCSRLSGVGRRAWAGASKSGGSEPVLGA
jgi:Acetyltransferase (GNAT) domain